VLELLGQQDCNPPELPADLGTAPQEGVAGAEGMAEGMGGFVSRGRVSPLAAEVGMTSGMTEDISAG
jgi:hypothetical protein